VKLREHKDALIEAKDKLVLETTEILKEKLNDLKNKKQ